jgi:hypothetical protein
VEDVMTATVHALAAPDEVGLAVHGLRVRLSGDWPEVLESVRLDFAWFGVLPPDPGQADVEVVVEHRAPDFDALGAVDASFVTPRNVVYQQDGRTIVDYAGRAVSVLDRATGRLTVQGDHRALVEEAVYLFLLSRIGAHLEERGLVRLHGLSLAGRDGATTVMLPSGGGKSTLALRALGDCGVRLLSEDSALLDRRGRLHPFPLRIGINETQAAAVPEGHVRRIDRIEGHTKLALEVHAFADRIESAPRPLRHLVIGRRSLGRVARLEPLPRAAALSPLLREMVVGVGIYQGMEFLLQRGLRDVTGMTSTFAGRAACAAAGLARARVWRLTLGRDHAANWATLRTLVAGD